ncbi:MAG: N-acetylmuramoyl-L-alanine amidase [Actinomycetota bacterium]|nr:N-acetylmuramoyl-L-alanine amidase [Actinomycetota bacterium]
MKLCLDPGHGGSDSGGVGINIVGPDNYEKDEVLAIGLAAARMARERGIEVMLTRETDVFVAIDKRYKMANAWGAELFLSIHTNAAGGRGIEVLYGKKKYRSLAADMAQRLSRATGWPLRQGGTGVWYKPSGVGVIKNTTMPAILTENGFIDYAAENAAMDTDEWTEVIAKVHVDFACDFFGVSSGDGEEEELMAARTASPVQKEHHFPDVWLEEFGTYWLHVQNRGGTQATVKCYAVLKASDGGAYIDLLGDEPIKLAPDGQAGTYKDFNIGSRIREKTQAKSVTLSVHADQPVVCVLREK